MTSSIFERVVRMMPAMQPVPLARIGRIMYLTPYQPEAGSSRHLSENWMMRISANQKPGMARKISAKTLEMLSISLY